jgi:lipopolysaccharide export system permease protein
LPFAVLVGSIATFMRLSRSSEVVAMRASGISTWRFLSPVAALALLLGVMSALVLGPFASKLNAVFEEKQLAISTPTMVMGAGAGNPAAWMRDRGLQHQLVITYQSLEGTVYRDVVLFTFDLKNSAFVARYDAKQATRTRDAWLLTDVLETKVGTSPRALPSARFDLTPARLLANQGDGQGVARTIPIWDLPQAAQSAALSGGSPQRFWLQFHRKLSMPITLLAMAMIAAVLSLSTNRSGNRAAMTAAAIAAGLVIFFLNDISGALATIGLAPSWVAAWSPPLTALFVALATVSYREDG